MYCTGHILSSTLLARLGSHRFTHRFFLLASLFIAVSALVFDHLLAFHLDDGTANSPVLHYLYICGGVLPQFILMWGFVAPRLLPFVFMVAWRVALPYAGDTLAYAFGHC